MTLKGFVIILRYNISDITTLYTIPNFSYICHENDNQKVVVAIYNKSNLKKKQKKRIDLIENNKP